MKIGIAGTGRIGAAIATRRPGPDPVRLVNISADTSGGPDVLRERVATIVATAQGKDTGPIPFEVDLMRKGLRTIIAEAASRGMTLPVAASALPCFNEAAQDEFNANDAVALPTRRMQRGRKSQTFALQPVDCLLTFRKDRKVGN